MRRQTAYVEEQRRAASTVVVPLTKSN